MNLLSRLFFCSISFLFLLSCQDLVDPDPTFEPASMEVGMTQITASFLISDSPEEFISQGVLLSPTPAVSLESAADTLENVFFGNFRNLAPGNIYYLKAYIEKEDEIFYSEEVEVSTLGLQDMEINVTTLQRGRTFHISGEGMPEDIDEYQVFFGDMPASLLFLDVQGLHVAIPNFLPGNSTEVHVSINGTEKEVPFTLEIEPWNDLILANDRPTDGPILVFEENLVFIDRQGGKVFSMDFASEVWEERSDFPGNTPFDATSLHIRSQERGYILGGESLWVYTNTNDTWESIPWADSLDIDGCLFELEGELYHYEWSRTINKGVMNWYNTSNQAWEIRSTLGEEDCPAISANYWGFALDEKAYVAAIHCPTGNRSDERRFQLWVYDPLTNDWSLSGSNETPLAVSENPFGLQELHVSNGDFGILGNTYSSTTDRDFLGYYRYDDLGDTWTALPDGSYRYSEKTTCLGLNSSWLIIKDNDSPLIQIHYVKP